MPHRLRLWEHADKIWHSSGQVKRLIVVRQSRMALFGDNSSEAFTFLIPPKNFNSWLELLCTQFKELTFGRQDLCEDFKHQATNVHWKHKVENYYLRIDFTADILLDEPWSIPLVHKRTNKK